MSVRNFALLRLTMSNTFVNRIQELVRSGVNGVLAAEELMDVIVGENSRFRVAWKSDRGLVRAVNEDSVLVDANLGLFAVADGMGGHRAGSVASRIAVGTLAEVVRQEQTHESDATTLLNEAILTSHRAIMAEALVNPDCEEMGTTLVAAFFAQRDSVVIGHVGDGRAYVIERGSIKALTQDHTFLAEWLRDGQITPMAARTHPARHGLFMALGIDDEIEPELKSVPWPDNACLLLCSDGLTDILDESDILSIIRDSASLESACEELIGTANIKGGPRQRHRYSRQADAER